MDMVQATRTKQNISPKRLISWPVAGLAIAAILSWAGPAGAQNNAARRFHPVPSPDGILGQHTTRGLGDARIFTLLTLDYANDELVLRQAGRTTDKPIAHRLVAEMGLTLGLWDRLDVSLSFPLVLGRWARGRLLAGQDRFAFGPASLRLMGKAVLMENRRWRGFGLALLLEASLPSGRKGQYLADRSPGFVPRILLDYRFAQRGVVSLNLGTWLREPMKMGDLRLGSEFLAGLGAEVPLGIWSLSALASLDAAIGLTTDESHHFSRRQAPLEARMGLRWTTKSGFQAVLGGGMGLTDGYGSPDLRILLSLGYSERNGRQKRHQEAFRPGILRETRQPAQPSRQGHPKTGGPAVGFHRAGMPHAGAARTRAPKQPSRSPAMERRNLPKGLPPDPDPDADGLAGALDRCPNRPEDRDGFQDEDGCPDPDNDRDGIPDIHDKCPNHPETVNGVADEDGCPDKGKAQVTLAHHRIRILQKIMFDRGSDRINPVSHPLLRQIAALLKKAWWVRLVRVEGYTDNRGDEEQNVDLSIRRAYRVRAFLVQHGVAPERLIAKGYGPSHPVATNKTAAGRAKNRRVVFTILDPSDDARRKGAAR